jgi:hypothetical protein
VNIGVASDMGRGGIARKRNRRTLKTKPTMVVPVFFIRGILWPALASMAFLYMKRFMVHMEHERTQGRERGGGRSGTKGCRGQPGRMPTIARSQQACAQRHPMQGPV